MTECSGPTIELSMIVRDGAGSLGRCLESVWPAVDRVVVGDTGSVDVTRELARGLGAEVIDVPWERDFARARNRVLSQAECDWILVLDADEMLDAAGPELVREAVGAAGRVTGRAEGRAAGGAEGRAADGAARAVAGIGAYDVWRWNYVRALSSRSGEEAPVANPGVVAAAGPYPAYVRSLNTRLFRRQAGIYFEHCVHETVAGRVAALGVVRREARFVIHHLGLAEDDERVRREKNALYQELGVQKLRASPGDFRSCFELGLGELEHFKRPAAALAYFERACALRPGEAKGWLFAGVCLTRLGRCGEALERLRRAETLDLALGLVRGLALGQGSKAGSPVLHEALGDACFHSGLYAEAAEAYGRAEAAGGVSSLNLAKLGAAEVRLGLEGHSGLVAAGLAHMQEAVGRDPGFGELYDILMAGALLGGDLGLASRTAEARAGVA